MTLRQLELFIAVAETGSFSRGAELSYLSQSTVSQHIAALEEEVGVPLFDRLGKGIALTSGGVLFLRHAKRILGETDAIYQAMNNFRGLNRAELIFGASNIPANYLVPPLLSTLKSEFPGISPTMLTGDSAEVIKMLEDSKIELALTGSRTESKEITFQPLVNDPLVLIVAFSHPWAKRDRLSIDELFNEPLIMRETGSGSGQALAHALLQNGCNPAELKIAARLGSNEAVLQAVANGYSGAFVSDLSVQNWNQTEGLCRVEVEGLIVERKIWMATMKDRTLSPAVEALTQLLKNSFHEKRRVTL